MKYIKKIICIILSFCMVSSLLIAQTNQVQAIEEINHLQEESIILNEDVALREESSKTFIKSDKTTEKIIYSIPVHKKKNEKWVEIDNNLISDGMDEEVSSDEVVGYKTKDSNFDIKFSKKMHKKNLVSIKDGDYKITWGFTNFVNKSIGNISNKNNNNDQINQVINQINQAIIYENVIENVDIEYDLNSLGIKENIVIQDKIDLNSFEFEYKVNNLKLVLNDKGEIEAINNKGIVIFVLPKPFMMDAEGHYSNQVNYILESSDENKYKVKIVANQKWMNEEERKYPVVIDPVILTKTTQSAIDTTFITYSQPTTNYSTKLEL